MYLRTTSRRNKDGAIVSYYQLAHNVRDPETKQSKPQVIHSFGRADDLDQGALKRLCSSIARVCGLSVFDRLEEDRPDQGSDGRLPDDLKLMRTVDLGTVTAIEGLWEQLGIGKTLRREAAAKGFSVPYERALLAMTANRLCAPESKLGVWDRWLKKVYMPDATALKLDHMYEAMDLLYACREKVEEAVFFHTADLMNLDVDLVFYDTTTTSFSIDYEDSDDTANDVSGLRKRGHSKEGTWTPQVVVALAVTREGIPVRSWVFPGNTSDVTTVEIVKADLKGWKLGRCMFVADSGMSSEQNRQELGKACGKYLLAMRVGSVKEIKASVLSHPGRFKMISENLHVKEVIVGDDGARRRRYILCLNPKEAKRQRDHRAEVIKELKARLSEHKCKDATAQWAIELLASSRYKRYVKILDTQIVIDRERIKASEKFDGKWVLITNDDTITVEDAAKGYKSLLVIERCFRALKRTQIKMGPMYHWLPNRIEAHVKICVLALLIERVAEMRCAKPWLRIHQILASLQATEFRTKHSVFFRRNEPSQQLSQTMNSLKISIPKPVLGLSKY